MKPLSIGEVAKLTGVRSSALRFYEAAGVLPAPARIKGRRCYDATVVRRVGLLRFAQQVGFSLEEIKQLGCEAGIETPFSAHWEVLVRKKLVELDVLAASIQRMQRELASSLECGCVRIEDCSLAPTRSAATPGRQPQPNRRRRC